MARNALFCSSLLLLSLVVVGQIFVGPQYQSQLNSQKAGQLYYTSLNNTNPSSFPTVGLLEIFLESMNVSFDTIADDMPNQFLGLQRRPKLIHSVGALALATWTPSSNTRGYTGIFGGCKNLLIRMSCAKKPSSGPKGYTPGIALKCLRSGVKSANLFAMYSLEGQDSWNFFKHDLTNHVPDLSANSDGTLQKLKGKFMEASDWPTFMGLADWARYDENGKNTSVPKFPFRLVFHPYKAVRAAFPDAPSTVPFENVIANTLKPGPLYQIYAQDQPTDPSSAFTLIGTITLNTVSTTSNFGDKYLYFQHSRFEEDLYYQPRWTAPALQILAQQQNTNYYTFPDLPFNV